MSTYERIAGLPLRIEGYSLEVRALELAPEFRRLTTVIHLHGGGRGGRRGGRLLRRSRSTTPRPRRARCCPWPATFDLDGFSGHLDGLDLFHAGAPVRPQMSIDYRRWAFESAALDLALRQAGASLADALELTRRPVRFVVSTRLDDPADAGAGRRLPRPGPRPALQARPDGRLVRRS